MRSKLLLSLGRRVPSLFSTARRHTSMLLHDDLNWYKSRHRIKSDSSSPNKQRSQIDGPSNHAFDIVSFNLLAPVYKRLGAKNAATGRRHREAGDYGLWRDRLLQTMEFFKHEIYKDAAIIALQEYWLDPRYRRLFEEQFHQHGYTWHVMQRTGSKADAVALVIKSEVFEIRKVKNINLCTFSDRVALLLWLRHRSTGFDLLVANTHLSFPHNVLDRLNQVAQMKHLTGVIEEFARKHGIENAPALIMGDFNVEAHSPVCDHLRNVGYYSAFEVCPPTNTQQCPANHTYVVQERDEYLSVVTHETCVLPSPNGATAPSVGVEGAQQRSRRDLTECDDVGDNCVIDVTGGSAPDASTATSTSTNAGGDREPVETVVPFVEAQSKVDSTSMAPTASRNSNSSLEHSLQATTASGSPAAAVRTTRTSTTTTTTTTTLHRTTRVSYVSHFNHRDEQVGVDHIFLKPLPHKHPEDESDAWEVVPACVPVAVPTKDTPGTDHSTSGSERSREASKLNIFVAECQVLPKHVGCAAWYPQFKISDHRPVRAKMIFTQREPTD